MGSGDRGLGRICTRKPCAAQELLQHFRGEYGVAGNMERLGIIAQVIFAADGIDAVEGAAGEQDGHSAPSQSSFRKRMRRPPCVICSTRSSNARTETGWAEGSAVTCKLPVAEAFRG